jgi:hypothetical protein
MSHRLQRSAFLSSSWAAFEPHRFALVDRFVEDGDDALGIDRLDQVLIEAGLLAAPPVLGAAPSVTATMT